MVLGRKKLATLERLWPEATIVDVTSKASEPWVRFSPFYAHGGIPIPNTPGAFAHSVEGLWQGLKVDEIRRKHPKVFKQWQESPQAICPPGGETLTEAVARVRKALEKPLKKKGRLAVVAADPLAAIICAVVRGATPEPIPAACSGACGHWEFLTAINSKPASGEFAAADLAATRST